MKKEKDTPDLEKYYYHRDLFNHPRITVCLLKFGENVYRGVSICSEQDNIIKEEGKFIAKNRALKARKLGYATLIIDRFESLDILAKCDIEHIFWKSEANPVLTEFETKLMYKEKRNVL